MIAHGDAPPLAEFLEDFEGVTRGQACGSGIVSVQVKAGHRTVSTRRVRLRGDCTFRSDVAFRSRRRLGHGRLKFTARFFGNRVVTAARAKARFARVR